MKQAKNTKPVSSEDASSLDMYLEEIGRQQRLTAEEEQTLLQQAKTGSRKAIDRLVTGNLRLVVSIAKQYQGQGVALGDLINEGNIGLIKAVERYESGAFAPFASKQIRRAVERAVEELGNITTPPHKDMSVDAPLKSNERLTMLDILPNGEAADADADIERQLLAGDLEEKMERLNERERTVVKAVFGIGQPHMTLAEVAQQMGIKRERARQIRDKALRAMRKKQ